MSSCAVSSNVRRNLSDSVGRQSTVPEFQARGHEKIEKNGVISCLFGLALFLTDLFV